MNRVIGILEKLNCQKCIDWVDGGRPAFTTPVKWLFIYCKCDDWHLNKSSGTQKEIEKYIKYWFIRYKR